MNIADSHAAENRLPYITMLLEQLHQGDPDFTLAFGRHVHWGWWEDPSRADGSLEDFAAASERLLARLLSHAALGDGQAILDCGCGFGGTVATINQMVSNARLVGLNIDERQIARAREKVLPQRGNTVDFVVADACNLPFPDASFDCITAVECIFHFPNRARFMQHVQRVLKPGGRFVISDFVLAATGVDSQDDVDDVDADLTSFLGPASFVTLAEYEALSAQLGMSLVAAEDISPGTMPSYEVCASLFSRLSEDAAWALRAVGSQQDIGARLYTLLAFQKAQRG